MVPKLLVFAVIACFIALSCGEVSEQPQPIPTVSPNSTSTSTTTTTTTTTTTAKSTTTPSTTTTATTTTHSTTTTPPSTTTQPVPVPTTNTTTPPPTTKTSTPTPPTTAPTTAPTTPKPSPKPPQKPDVGKWSVTDDNVTCILVDMAIQLNVSYPVVKNETKYSILNVPKNINASGTCGNTSQLFNLTWFENGTRSELHITFTKKEDKFMISMIDLEVDPDEIVFPDITNKSVIELLNNKTEFSTPVTKSYLCAKEQTFGLWRNGSNTTEAEITVSHVHLEAFNAKDKRDFGAAEDCEPSSSPDIVPIAVGCCLGGLVLIVLIAYLVGRRRSQARGYLSM